MPNKHTNSAHPEAAGPSASGQTSDLLFVVLAAAVFAGISYQLLESMFESLWLDETATWYLSSRGIGRMVLEESVYPIHIAYYALTSLLFSSGVTSEFFLRLPSFIFIIHTVYLLSALSLLLIPAGNKLDRLVLIFSCFFLFNHIFIFVAIKARPYAMLVWLAVLSIYYFVIYVQNRKVIPCLIFTTATFLVVISHLLYTPILALEFILLAYLCFPARETFRWRPFIRISLLLTLIGIVSVIISLWFGGLLSSRVTAAYDYLPRSTAGGELLTLSKYLSKPAYPAFLITLVCSLLLWRSNRSPFHVIILLTTCFLMALVPLIVISGISLYFGVSLTGTSQYSFLRIIGESLALALLMGLLPDQSKNLRRFILLLLAVGSLAWFNMPRRGEDWRSLASHIEAASESAPCLALVLSGHPEAEQDLWFDVKGATEAWTAPLLAYKADRFCKVGLMGSVSQSKRFAGYTQKLLLHDPRRIFLVFKHPPPPRIQNTILEPMGALLNKNGFQLSDERSFTALTLRMYVKGAEK